MVDCSKILFPVDLSGVSKLIIPYVITAAKKLEAEIHLIFVARILDYFTELYVPSPMVKQFENEITVGGTKKIEEFVKKHLQGYEKIKLVVANGDAAEQILNYIDAENIDMVIMGTHGRKTIERAFFGSVAEKVIKTSPVPVLSVNPYRKRKKA